MARAIPGWWSRRAGLRVSRSRDGARSSSSGEELLRARERIALASAEESGLLEPGTERGLEQPDGMEVAPAAGPLLEVGLQQVRGGTEAFRPAGGVFTDRRREPSRVPPRPPRHPRSRVVDDPSTPASGACRASPPPRPASRKRPSTRGVRTVCPTSNPAFQRGIQQCVRESRHRVLVGAVVQDEQVDIGSRQQESAPVPARCGDGRPGRRAGALEEFHEGRVDERRTPARRPDALVIPASRRARALRTPPGGWQRGRGRRPRDR